MNNSLVKRSIIVVLLLLLFVTGLYVGNNNSYSLSVIDNSKKLEKNIEDEILILNSISFSESSAKAGDIVPVKIDTSGAKLNSATINLVRDDGKYTLNLIVEDMDSNPYVEMPQFINNGTYLIKSLSLVAFNPNETTFIKNFTTKPNGSGDVYYNFNTSIKLEADINNVTVDLIKSIKLERSTFTQGAKVNVSIDADKDVRAIRLNFKHSDSYSGIYSYVNSINKNAYIVIAKSAKMGDYVLDSIYVETYNYGSVLYKNVEEEDSKYLEYDANYAVLQFNSENSSSVYYNNADIDSNTISTIKSSEIINDIYIIAHDEPVIAADLFAALANSNKRLHVDYKGVEYVFEGSNINNIKMFDATTDIKLSKNDTKIDIDGLVVKMAGRGELPGKAKVIVKESSLFDKAFDNNKVNIYAFNDRNKTYELVNENVKLNDKAYQFEIDNSNTYLLTNSKINNVKVASSSNEENKDNKVINKNSLNNILLIIIGLLVVILILLIIILFKKKEPISKQEKKVLEDHDFEEIKEELNDDISEEEIINNIAKSNEESREDDE